MRKPIDVRKLLSTFRIRDGNLERYHEWKTKDSTWKPVKIKANSLGYCQVRFNNVLIFHHVIIWILSTGKDIPSNLQIDHINGNKIDNRIENLRLVTNSGNAKNRKEHRGGKLVGCCYNKRTRKYIAYTRISGKMIYIGCFTTEQEAHEAYKIACKHIKSYVDNESFRCMIRKLLPNN